MKEYYILKPRNLTGAQAPLAPLWIRHWLLSSSNHIEPLHCKVLDFASDSLNLLPERMLYSMYSDQESYTPVKSSFSADLIPKKLSECNLWLYGGIL